jgi:hypothetical protein
MNGSGALGRSLAPPSSPPERRANFVAHAIVNGVCALTAGACHVWGSLGPELTAGLLFAIAGAWGVSTRRGPPGATAGLVGLAGSIVDTFVRR